MIRTSLVSSQHGRLQLQGMCLTELPSELFCLKKLKAIFANDNQLCSLPSEIKHLTKLKELMLGVNRFASLPSELFLLTNLEGLYVGEKATRGRRIVISV
jgi:leucine-rich repeat protein SHOC2